MNVTDLAEMDALSPQRWISSTTEEIFLASTSDPHAEDEISRFSRSLLTFAAVMTIIIMMTGIFGNLLTILALLKCPKVRNVAAAFIISLCLADCLFCAIVLPFSAFRFIQGTWTHGDFLCRLIPFIQYGNIGVSLLCIAMITINRYVMIAHHSGYAKIYKRHWIGAMIAFCWLFAYGMQLPTLFGVWGTFGYDSKLGTCSIMNDTNGNSSKTALFIIAFVIPCIIIIGCYAKIFWVVHRSEVRLRQHANKQNSIPNNLRQMPTCTGSNGTSNRVSSPVSSSSFSGTSGAEASKYGTSQKTIRVKDQRDIKAKRNEWRITKMVLAIFLSFVVCYLPITVVKVVDKDVYSPGWHIFGYIMLYMSACINPIIYVIMNKQYRKAYKTVLMCQPSRLLPFTNAGSSAGEMERHRVQLQSQPYNCVTGFCSRPTNEQQQLQQQSITSCARAIASNAAVSNVNAECTEQRPSIDKYEQKFRPYFPQYQNYDGFQFSKSLDDGYLYGIEQQQQSSDESERRHMPSPSDSPTIVIPTARVTATIYQTPRRYSSSRFSNHLSRGGYHSGGGGGGGRGGGGAGDGDRRRTPDVISDLPHESIQNIREPRDQQPNVGQSILSRERSAVQTRLQAKYQRHSR